MRINSIDKPSVTLKGLGRGMEAKTGFYLIPETGYNGKYANATQENANKVLPILRKTANSSEGERRRINVASSLSEDEILQSGMYEKGFRGEIQGSNQSIRGKLSGKAHIHQVGDMRNMSSEETDRNSPQRSQQAQQQSSEFAGDLSGLSHQTTHDSKEKEIFNKNASQEQTWAIRRLTPRETELLQGFPPDWTKYGKDGELISDTQRYKMMGNAVTTNVISYIGQKLIS